MDSDGDERLSEDGFGTSSYASPSKLRTTEKRLRAQTPSRDAAPSPPRPSPPRITHSSPLRTSPLRSTLPSSSPVRSTAATASHHPLSAVHTVTHPPLSPSEMEELRSAFNVFDRHQSGAVATSFLLSTLASLGYAASHQLVYSLLSSTPLTSLTFDDFLALMTARIGEGSSREEVERVFALFDEGGKGWMDEADLERVGRLVGERMGARERKEMMATADINQDGVVSKDEFFLLMTVSAGS